jgi:hypothetical protein
MTSFQIKLNKEQHQFITIDEFSLFTGIATEHIHPFITN